MSSQRDPDDTTATDDPAVANPGGGAPVDEDRDGDGGGNGDSEGDGTGTETGVVEGPSGREVVVPMRLYKTVTVVGTLLAMVAIVAGFVALDAATNRARAAIEDVDPLLALLGLGLIVGGAAAYALSTRFRAEGMGSSKTDEDRSPDNG